MASRSNLWKWRSWVADPEAAIVIHVWQQLYGINQAWYLSHSQIDSNSSRFGLDCCGLVPIGFAQIFQDYFIRLVQCQQILSVDEL